MVQESEFLDPPLYPEGRDPPKPEYGMSPRQSKAWPWISLPCLTLHCIDLHYLALHCIALPCIALPFLALRCLSHNHNHIHREGRGGRPASRRGERETSNPRPYIANYI